MNPARQIVEALVEMEPEQAAAALAAMGERAVKTLGDTWGGWAHDGQDAPPGDWRVWMMMAGRGFGKTRAGAEYVSSWARANPGAAIALVAATMDEARAVMVTGRSGLLAVAHAEEREEMKWEAPKGRLVFANGAEAYCFSGASPEKLRGPEHHLAWCDELAKWKRPEESWTNLQLGLRLGARPRALVTTTPRSSQALKEVLGEDGVIQTGGGTAANPHVSDVFAGEMARRYGGTRLGRQELDGELLTDVEGALWKRELIEACRVRPGDKGAMARVVIGVDPPASASGDACGIVAVGLGEDGIAYVLGDHSVGGCSPEGWARKVAAAAETHGASRVVAEANNGGDMVKSVLIAAGANMGVTLVHAAEGKAARAEPVSILFESGKAKLGGTFPALEDELAGLTLAGRYEGPGRSPDRADAMVWAMTELMLKGERAEPRVRRL